jgi:ABC-type phosphate/phosphonate transport system substrate-binding protein
VLAVALRDEPTLARSLRVIDSLGPSTIQPIAVSKRLPRALRDRIRGALLSLHHDAAARLRLARGLVKRFVPVDASSYDDIRMMRDACEAAGFMHLR